MSYYSEILADSPALLLRLEEASGATTAIDTSGHGRNFVANNVSFGGASLLGDGSGSSATFNGTSSVLSLTSAAWMDSTSITAVVRYKHVTDAGTRMFMGRWGGAGQRPWLFYVTGNKLQCQINDGGAAAVGATTLSNGVVYTIAIRADNSTVKLYLNGVEDASASLAGPTQAGNFDLGRASGSAFTPGQIQGFAFFTTAISPSRLLDYHVAAATTATGSLSLTGYKPTASISASIIDPIDASLGLTSPKVTADISASYTERTEADLALTGPVLTGSISATYDPAPIECTLAGILPVPSLSLSASRRVFVPPTTLEYADDHFFGRYGIPVGQSVVLTDGHYATTPYPWLGEIADLEEGTEWFQGGRTYDIDAATAAALTADGYTLTEV